MRAHATRAHGPEAALQALALLLVLACMRAAWVLARAFARAHAARVAAWESQQWWWRQCADMEFYERVQHHMDVCDNLEVVPRDSLWLLAARDAADELLLALGAWQSWAPLAAMAAAGAAAVSAAVAQHASGRRQRLPNLPRQRPTV
jgi:hypothetical protein